MLAGEPIQVSVLPSLTAWRGKLLSQSDKGIAVHAGSFLHKRKIILETELLRTPHRLARIFVHEVFHFVWWKLGPDRRAEYASLIAREIRTGVEGELGWSAECRKKQLTSQDVRLRSARWKLYVCESFCDTAAWMFGGRRRYAEATLPFEQREQRKRWIAHALPSPLRT